MKKASALIISLLILSTILLIGLSVSVTTIKEQKSVMESEKSNIAYQIAESGIEYAMQKLLAVADPALEEISSVFFDPDCSDGKILGNLGDGEYTVLFLEDDGETLSCDDLVSEVRIIKSIGSFQTNQRALGAPVIFPVGP